MDDKVGKLEETAVKRKERLLALRKRKRGGDTEEKTVSSGDLPASQVLFRNYQPAAEQFTDSVIPQVEPEKVENLIEDQLKNAQTTNQIVDVEISNLAPRKITYDLKRGIQSQLDRLDKRTDRAIAELIRERLKSGIQQDFSLAVNVGAQMQRKDYESDED